MYHNYHKHDHYGNPWTMDVVVKPEEYCRRAIELGHTTVFTVNHGMTGNVFEWMELAKKYKLKWCYGTEGYFVKNRFEKDRSNKHIIVVAKNNDGFYQLNDIMTEAHQTGFYYRPRIDEELLFSLEPQNFIVTTACVGGIWEDTELILALHRKFGDNFFLELQSHNIDIQKTVNTKMLMLSREAGIQIIHANDSHYIYPEDSKYREILQRDKGVAYEHEDQMVLDYPDEQTIHDRYREQGLLSESEVRLALQNTLVFDECEPITTINTEIKLPPVSDNPSEDLRKVLRKQWLKERQHIPRERWKEYTDAIQYELDIIEKTHMENYFLIDYIVARDGQSKYDGRLTNTGRGSAPSFYVTKLLGLTDIDRLASPITLYPHRFMSVDRILNAKSLPDIDLNTTDRVPFIKATEDLLGKENCAWMLSWKPFQAASAFRAYCKGIGMELSEYDEVAKNLESFQDDPKWKNIIEESKRFIGVTESVSESPCSMLLYDKPVRRELGLVRTSAGQLCCLLDGKNCDKYKYLKNDYLTVTVWAIIREVCKSAGIPIPTISQLDELLDDKTFDIYKNGLTCTINQADSAWATEIAKIYCPHSVSEMSAFVAIIRPGCASLLQDFIHRKSYTTGVEALDELLEEGNHRMIYQELIMRYLIWLGIPATGSYDIIKKISKKVFKEPELVALKKQLLQGWVDKLHTENHFAETWTVVEQASRYSFNACLSGDTIISRAGSKGHWKPTIQEMFRIKHDETYAKKTNHYDLHRKYKRYGYGKALSMFDDGRVRSNQIVDIYDSGIGDIYRVTTSNGSYIDCTMNHKIPTPHGKKLLSELQVGDKLFVVDQYEINHTKYPFTDGKYDPNIPRKGQRGFQKNPNGNYVVFQGIRKKHIQNTDECSVCGREFHCNNRFELHHVDFDRTNNAPTNLAWMCCSCHKAAHYQHGRTKQYQKGIPTVLSEIVSIEFIRRDHVYDVEMADPAHTIISESGLVVSNSHSLSYAYDSLYGAYLKSHYPLDYYTVAMNFYDGDIPRTNRLTTELNSFGIQLKPIQFRHSRGTYSLSRESNEIFKGIQSIKDMNGDMAEELYALRDRKYSSFYELLRDIKQNTTARKNQIEVLIRLGYFSEFGDANKLLLERDLYSRYCDRSQISKSDIDDLPFTIDEIRLFSQNETEKQFRGIDFMGLLIHNENHIQYEPFSVFEKASAQAIYMGYCDVVEPDYKNYGVVIDVDTKYAPRLKIYSLRRGTTVDCKMSKKHFQSNPMQTGDVIYIGNWAPRPRTKKTANGWVPIEPVQMDIWISDVTFKIKAKRGKQDHT